MEEMSTFELVDSGCYLQVGQQLTTDSRCQCGNMAMVTSSSVNTPM